MKEAGIQNILLDHFGTTDNGFGFYANYIHKVDKTKAILAAFSPRSASRLAVSMIDYYIIGVSESGVFFSRFEARKWIPGKVLSWDTIDNVQITEGFMAFTFKFEFADGGCVNFKVMKTLIGLNHSNKTQDFKVLLKDINKLKDN